MIELIGLTSHVRKHNIITYLYKIKITFANNMKPNIFLLTIDQVRADRFYGPKKTAITPNLDNIIKKGIFFSQNISSSDQTGTSLASIFTGKYPIKSGVTQFNFNFEFTTFFDHLANLGYSLYSSVPDLSILQKITKNFKKNISYIYGGTNVYPHLDDQLGNDILEQFQNNSMNEPWLFFCHLMDLKDPVVWSSEYDDPKFGETIFERNLSSLDKWIGKILENIDLKKTIFVITSDHGGYIFPKKRNLENSIRKFSSLGKKSNILETVGKKPFLLSMKIARRILQNQAKNLTPFERRNFHLARGSTELFDDTVKVPLLFIGYGIDKPKIISSQVRHIDIFPTIFDLAGFSLPDSTIDGRSNIPLLKDEPFDDVPVYIETGSRIPKELGHTIGVRTSKYKYFRSRINPLENVNLYDLEKDPKEEYNISDKNLIEKMETILSNIVQKSKSSKTHEITEEDSVNLEDELRRMGYI